MFAKIPPSIKGEPHVSLFSRVVDVSISLTGIQHEYPKRESAVNIHRGVLSVVRIFRQSGMHKTTALFANQRSCSELPYNLPNATEDFLVGFLDIGIAVGFPPTNLVGSCRHRSYHRRCLVGSIP